MAAMAVIDFEPRHADAFRTLNEAWINRFFAMEGKDAEIIGDPQGQIIAKGGHVFLAVEEDGAPVGCVALIPMADGGFELAKMAVAEASQGRGHAKALMAACVERARSCGASRLYLESNEILTPARALYRAFGFRDLEPERRLASPYSRANVWMELML
jgi:N-acetylglutamate synthase-like GNAT family acetyltransferase